MAIASRSRVGAIRHAAEARSSACVAL
jgi:hypothetical protein